MYIVTLKNGDIETPIHGEKEKLLSGKIVKGINAIDSFTFSMLPNNAGFNLINEFTTLVKVYNTNKGRYEFMGRVLYPESEMSEDGLITKKVTCENLFGYLCDSQQKYVNTQNWTVSGLFRHLIDCHNSQVEEYKRFTVGKVTATDDNDNLYLGIQRENTWDAIKSNLIDKIGGELQFRVEGGVTYIDYLEKIGEGKETEIALSVNMKSIVREKDPTSFVTRLIPLGCKLEDSEERLDISSVNGGLDYIDDDDAKAIYGIHVGIVEFDDVTTASILLTKGRNWLKENNRVQIRYSISALDLSLINLDFDDFNVGNYHPIKNALLGIDDNARIIKQSIDICDEVKSTIEVGDNFKTLSDIEIEQQKAAAKNIVTLKQATSGLQGDVASAQTDLNALTLKVENIEAVDQTALFNRLTNNGKSQGIYMKDGEIYVNASYIGSGFISADIIRAGYIRSTDFQLTEYEVLYPSDDLFPYDTAYPSNGEQIIRGFEIDFEHGIIRGVFWSEITDELTERVVQLESQVADLEERATSHEEVISILEASNSELKEQVTALEQTTAELENANAELETRLLEQEVQTDGILVTNQDILYRLTKLENALVYPKSIS